MSCDQFELADVYDYSDGSLDSRRRLAFESHVSACAHCRTALTDVRRMADDFERLPIPVPAPSAGFRDAVFSGAEGLLKRLREEGTAPARPSRGRSAPTLGVDSRHSAPSSDRPEGPRIRWHRRPAARFAALAAAILVIAVVFNFTVDRSVVASILDGDNVLVKGEKYVGGTVELGPGDTIETEARRAGSFISASGESVVLGPNSRLVVRGRDEDGCLVLWLERGRAWILIDEGRGKPAGVDMEKGEGAHDSLTGGEAFVYNDPNGGGYKIEVAPCGGSDASSPDCPRLERARLDEVVAEILKEVEPKTAERARHHYDKVKPTPIHWVKDLGHAALIARNLLRPILVVDERGGLADELFATDEALRSAASRYVCVKIRRDTPGLDRFLENVEPKERRSESRLLLCPQSKFRAAIAADAPLSVLISEMEKVCDDVTEKWRPR